MSTEVKSYQTKIKRRTDFIREDPKAEVLNCEHGHPLTKENVLYGEDIDNYGDVVVTKKCKTCILNGLKKKNKLVCKPEEAETYGEWMKSIRVASELSKEQLGKLIGLSGSGVGSIENGSSLGSTKVFAKFCIKMKLTAVSIHKGLELIASIDDEETIKPSEAIIDNIGDGPEVTLVVDGHTITM